MQLLADYPDRGRTYLERPCTELEHVGQLVDVGEAVVLDPEPNTPERGRPREPLDRLDVRRAPSSLQLRAHRAVLKGGDPRSTGIAHKEGGLADEISSVLPEPGDESVADRQRWRGFAIRRVSARQSVTTRRILGNDLGTVGANQIQTDTVRYRSPLADCPKVQPYTDRYSCIQMNRNNLKSPGTLVPCGWSCTLRVLDCQPPGRLTANPAPGT